MNDVMKQTLDRMKQDQSDALRALNQHKALATSLETEIEQREMSINLLTAALDPNKKNDTIAQSIK